MTRTDNTAADLANDNQWLIDMLADNEATFDADEARAKSDAIAQAVAALEALRSAKALLAAAAAAVEAVDNGHLYQPMALLTSALEDASSVDLDELDAQLSTIC